MHPNNGCNEERIPIGAASASRGDNSLQLNCGKVSRHDQEMVLNCKPTFNSPLDDCFNVECVK